jgi:sialidase-1
VVDVFVSGSTTSNGGSGGAYVKTRIPAIVRTGNTLVAFCEGRRIDDDFGNIDIICSRSTDNGATWTGTDCIRVVDNGSLTAGNPAPVVNSQGHIVLLYITQATDPAGAGGRVLNKIVSTDGGATWGSSTSLASIQDSSWTWFAVGPAHGIRKQYGIHKGRLIVSYHGVSASARHCGFLYSDDDGATWIRGGTHHETGTTYQVDETAVAEMPDGSLVMITRNEPSGGKIHFTSTDGGETISSPANANITSPNVQGSLLCADRHPSQLLYEATPESLSGSNRINLRISVSSNGGTSWTQHKFINANAAYSDMVMLDGGNTIGILYEQGVSPQYQRIVFEQVKITSIAKVGSTTTAATTSDQTSLACNKPSSVVEGNVLIAAVTSNNANATAPSGWNEFHDAGSAIRTQIFWKTATSSEPSSYTWSFSGARPIGIAISAWENVDNFSPIAGTATPTVGTTIDPEPGTTPTLTNNTAVTGRTMYLRSAYNSNSTTLVTFTASGVTEVADAGVQTAFTARSIGWYADNEDFTGNGSSKTGLAITASTTEEENLRFTWTLRANEPILGTDESPGTEGTPSIAFTGTGDTGSGAEGTASIRFNGTDSCSGASNQSLTTSQTRTDTCSGTELSSISASQTRTDTASATESHSIQVVFTRTDTASGTDAGSLVASLTGTDTSSGTDNQTVDQGEEPVEDSDTVISSEEYSIAAGLPGSDTGSATESHTIVATLPVFTDTGSSTDDGFIGQFVIQDDSVTATEAVVSIPATLTNSDTVLADDSVGDDVTLIVATLPTQTDTGSATEDQDASLESDNPNPPSNLIALAVSSSQINLSWNTVPGASYYQVERDGVVINDHVTATSFEDKGLAPRTIYTYRVRAVRVIF